MTADPVVLGAELPGRETPRTREAELPVSEHAIRVWCEAIGEANPVHRDRAAARRAGFADLVAPAAMLQTWTMPFGAASSPSLHGSVREAARRAGYGHVVATDYEQTYGRPLVPGDVLTEHSWVEGVSAEKATALGRGRFVSIAMSLHDDTGAEVGTTRSRTFYFSPDDAGPRTPRSTPPDDDRGEALPVLSIPLDRRLVVASALASRDHEPVHLDHVAARAQGLPDVIASIVTTSGLVLRYLGERLPPGTWCGRLTLTLATPAVPGDTLVLIGVHDAAAGRVRVVGDHERGRHVAATVADVAPPLGSLP